MCLRFSALPLRKVNFLRKPDVTNASAKQRSSPLNSNPVVLMLTEWGLELIKHTVTCRREAVCYASTGRGGLTWQVRCESPYLRTQVEVAVYRQNWVCVVLDAERKQLLACVLEVLFQKELRRCGQEKMLAVWGTDILWRSHWGGNICHLEEIQVREKPDQIIFF